MVEWLIGWIVSNAFLHRKFLEYFCAWELVWQFEKEHSISIEDLKTEVFGKHWQNETWNEVLRLIAGMIQAKVVGEILDYLMVQDGEEEKFINLFLAAKCLAEVRNRSIIAPVANKLLNKLIDLTKYEPWYYYRLYQNAEETKLIQKVRTQAIATIAANWKDNPHTLHCLKDRATADDDDEYVRGVAIKVLASNFKDDPDTRSFLKDLATADNEGYVRRAAIKALASNFPDDLDTRSILKDRATADDEWNVRVAAIKALASNFPDDPDTRSILKDRATADNEVDVRYRAIKALASNFPDDPDTRSILKDRATADNERDVRCAAIQALAKHFRNQPELFEIYYNCAVNDSFEGSHDPWYHPNPRRIALEIIIKQFPQHPQTLPLLRDKAENDPDEQVRKFAQEKLKQWEE